MSSGKYLRLPRLYAAAPIKLKILALALTALLAPTILSVSLIRANYSAVESFSDDVALYSAVNRLKTYNEANTIDLQDFLRSGSMEDLALYNAGIDAFVANLTKVARDEEDLEVRFLVTSLLNSFDSRYEEAHSAIRAVIEGKESPYPAFYRAERIGRYMDGYLSMLMDRSLVVGTATYQARLENAALTRSTSIGALAALLLLLIGLSVLVANYLSTPVRRLSAAAARMASGDLTVAPVPVAARDEVGALTVAFNNMNKRIAEMVEGIKEKARIERRLHNEELRNERNKKLLKESEFLALQARIQPHFLFNSLNSISRDVMLRGGKDAVNLVLSLSALLRYSLEKAGQLSTLATELEIVRQYAYIQSYRFSDRITVNIVCSIDDAQRIRLPSFTLQPLVENAFTHGLEPKLSGGVIQVNVKRERRGVVISVQDNGIGMSAERLKAVARAGNGFARSPSIGIANVRERLRMFTGDPRCLSLRSKPDQGTTVRIILRGKGNEKRDKAADSRR